MFIEVIGIIADVLFVLAYFLVSRGKVDGKGFSYNAMNLVGAILMGIHAFSKGTMPVLILEGFWGGIALIALAAYLDRRYAANSTSATTGS